MYKNIGVVCVYEGQLESINPLEGNVYNWEAKTSETVIGYVAFFELLVGFKKTMYITKAEASAHGLKYSKAYSYIWEKEFDKMAMKTVLKSLLGTYAPKSAEMKQVMLFDQAVIKDAENGIFSYPDNPNTINDNKADEVINRISLQMNKCTTLEQLNELALAVPDEHRHIIYDKITDFEAKGDIATDVTIILEPNNLPTKKTTKKTNDKTANDSRTKRGDSQQTIQM